MDVITRTVRATAERACKEEGSGVGTTAGEGTDTAVPWADARGMHGGARTQQTTGTAKTRSALDRTPGTELIKER